eukprot:3505172-Rhodomonas_salina.1
MLPRAGWAGCARGRGCARRSAARSSTLMFASSSRSIACCTSLLSVSICSINFSFSSSCQARKR